MVVLSGPDAEFPANSESPVAAQPPVTIEPVSQSAVDSTGNAQASSQNTTSSTPASPIYRMPSEYAYFTAEKKPTPSYPQEALDKGMGGDVILSVEYSTDGNVTEVQRIDGDPVLTKASTEAASNWRFLPIVEKGQKSRGFFPFGKWAETPPPPDPKARLRVRISSGVAAKDKTGGSNPRYPESAKYNHVQGEVQLRAVIDKQGNISLLEIVKTPSQDLAISAIEAVKTWRYQPYVLNGEPVEVETVIIVRYTLG
jgi:TonB family protein